MSIVAAGATLPLFSCLSISLWDNGITTIHLKFTKK
jgi:hypothetical protein